jgi:hypothetical protein
LIGDCQRSHQLPAGCIRIFGAGKDGRKIVAGVAGFTLGQISVIEIQVTYERAIVKGC